MRESSYISIVVPKLKNIDDVKKIVIEYFGNYGTVNFKNGSEKEKIATFLLHLDSEKLNTTVGNRNHEDKFYQHEIEFSICEHGLLLFKVANMDDDIYSEIGRDLDTIYHRLEHMVKHMGIHEETPYLEKEEFNIAMDTGSKHVDEKIDDIVLSHLDNRKKEIEKIISVQSINFTNATSIEGKIRCIEILEAQRKFLEGYFYKLQYGAEECSLFCLRTREIERIVNELLDKLKQTKDNLTEKIGGIQVDSQEMDIVNFQFLFMDIVGFSAKGVDVNAQIRMVKTLNGLITYWFSQEKLPKDQYFIITTGDGMVIGFRSSDPRFVFKLAREIQTNLRKRRSSKKGKNLLEVRIGLENGLVYPFRNIKNEIDYIGPGIINARRVMDCGGPCQILASDKIAEEVKKIDSRYEKNLHKIAKSYKIRKDEKIIVHNFYGGNFGNRKEPPHKIQKS